ncbi:hypothetical protein GTG28_08685 [Vibrio sp. OCN044]|uniref:Xylose isomerase-like TIM barrel domain-containing protein n=1 Tax=Vibrio tetraodonis subsp. pristinus TaxID=2695891 RepID=A0A6L8M121_9VIBR|nr:hypothetical protein [Vibrio tetraodonis]MYM59299.1 hypothetical protein [Vibrio tetraodonis subsp. pristinus]
MNPKVGIVEWCLAESGPRAIEAAKAHGLSCIQLNFTRDYEIGNYRRKILSASDSTGVSISAIAINILNEYKLLDISSCDFDQPHKLFSLALNSAIELKVKHIFIPSFYTGKISTKEDIIQISLFYKWACSLALKHNIMVSTENNLPVDKAMYLYNLVNKVNFRFIFDPYNYVVENIDPHDIYGRLGYIFHDQVHIKSGNVNKGGTRPLNNVFFNLKNVVLNVSRDSIFYLENKYHVIGYDYIQDDIDWLLGTLGAH